MSVQNNPKPLNIIQINVGSLRTNIRRQNMSAFIKIHKPEVVLINEMVINHNHNVNFRDYIFTRNNKIPNEPGRGTGILVKHNIKHEPIDTTAWKLKTLEASAVKIHTTGGLLFVIAAYRYNGSRTSIDTEDLDKMITKFRLSNASQLVIGGDLNARHMNWGNNTNCSSGLKLDHWIQNLQDFKLLQTEEPTYYRLDYSSFLDVFIVSNSLNVIYPVQHPNKLDILDYPSDHRAVHLKILPIAA